MRDDQREGFASGLSELGLSDLASLVGLRKEGYEVGCEDLDVDLRVLVLEDVRAEAKEASDSLGEGVDNAIHIGDHVLEVGLDRLNHTHVLDAFYQVRELLDQDLHMEAVTVSVSRKKLSFLVEDHLPPSLKEALHELSVVFGEDSRHKDVNRMANDFVLGVAENLG